MKRDTFPGNKLVKSMYLFLLLLLFLVVLGFGATHKVFIVVHRLSLEAVNGLLTVMASLVAEHCRGIGPHLVARGKSHGFSRVAAGTWGTFSSYDGDAHSKPEFV